MEILVKIEIEIQIAQSFIATLNEVWYLIRVRGNRKENASVSFKAEFIKHKAFKVGGKMIVFIYCNGLFYEKMNLIGITKEEGPVV